MADTTSVQNDPLTTLIGQLFSGYQGLGTGPLSATGQAEKAAAAADPFASQRPQYQQQLQGLLTDPSSFKTDPGYQFALGQGQEGISRASNALYGTQRTGHLAPELAKFTEGYASQAYSDRINQLTTLAGGNQGSPAAAGTLLAGGAANQNAALAGGIGGLGNLLNALLGTGSGGAGATGATQLIKALLGGSGGGGGLGDFTGLTSGDFGGLGLGQDQGPFGMDPTIQQNLEGVLSPPGATPIDLGQSGDWITNTFGDLFGG
jgi:hypothetical protein